jgi:LPXTG-site transpeptidase (sortase) family protein
MKITEDDMKKIFGPEPQPTGNIDDIKKVRKDITRAPSHKLRRRKRDSFWDQILRFFALSGFTGCAVFILMGWGGISAQLEWVYFKNYLDRPIPVASTPTAVAIITPKPTATPLPTPTPTPLPTITPEIVQVPGYIPEVAAAEGNFIKNDKISLFAPVIWDVPEASMIDRLKDGVAHYQGTSYPGDGGNIFIVGHSSNYLWVKSDYNHVFALLDKLENGDRIEIRKGRKSYFYEVNDKKIIKPGEVEILQNTQKETLTLMTCWPIGTSLKRLIVQAQYVYSSN